MKVLRIINIITIFLLIFTSSCYYDVEEELYPTLECDTTDMSYNTDIIPILETNCYSCHNIESNFGNITLEGYEEITKYVNNDLLLGSIRHEAGYSPMPKNKAMILDCEIEKIEKWIQNGALNN